MTPIVLMVQSIIGTPPEGFEELEYKVCAVILLMFLFGILSLLGNFQKSLNRRKS